MILEHLQYIAVALMWLIFGGGVVCVLLIISILVAGLRSL